MSQFPVTIGTQTFTENDFYGLAYLTGIPNSVEAMGDTALLSSLGQTTANFSSNVSGNLSVSFQTARGIAAGMIVKIFTSSSAFQYAKILSYNSATGAAEIERLPYSSIGQTITSGSNILVARHSVYSTYFNSNQPVSRPMNQGGTGVDLRGRACNGILRHFDPFFGTKEISLIANRHGNYSSFINIETTPKRIYQDWKFWNSSNQPSDIVLCSVSEFDFYQTGIFLGIWNQSLPADFTPKINNYDFYYGEYPNINLNNGKLILVFDGFFNKVNIENPLSRAESFFGLSSGILAKIGYLLTQEGANTKLELLLFRNKINLLDFENTKQVLVIDPVTWQISVYIFNGSILDINWSNPNYTYTVPSSYRNVTYIAGGYGRGNIVPESLASGFTFGLTLRSFYLSQEISR